MAQLQICLSLQNHRQQQHGSFHTKHSLAPDISSPLSDKGSVSQPTQCLCPTFFSCDILQNKPPTLSDTGITGKVTFKRPIDGRSSAWRTDAATEAAVVAFAACIVTRSVDSSATSSRNGLIREDSSLAETSLSLHHKETPSPHCGAFFFFLFF